MNDLEMVIAKRRIAWETAEDFDAWERKVRRACRWQLPFSRAAALRRYDTPLSIVIRVQRKKWTGTDEEFSQWEQKVRAEWR